VRIYLDVAGFSLNVDLSKKEPPATKAADDQPPTQLATPMRTAGFYTAGAVESDAAYITNETGR
jgi:hypothetical protein